MRTIEDLIIEANSLLYRDDVMVGAVTADGILAALAILEAAKRAPQPTARRSREPYQPVNPDRVLEHFTTEGSQVELTTAPEAYAAIYGRDANTAELRTMAAALRAAGWVAYRSNGRTMFRRRNPATDGYLGLENSAEIYNRVRAWAADQEKVFATASEVFRHIFEREPSGTEARAVGTVLREAGFVSKKYGGRLIFTVR
ncbi:hypothetical protein AWB77_06731 [Caballeronia fortuita]|uniref:Uncharacterized protein n=1 Tax=Caballeronia fortuita TaxID=1777138 RepID=A0A158E8J5_9BURK|nr:hypothetical protein [Caballeronia fortuita]SAL03189.1 hypothetical protein AWB77_06731 [Caballeronia fortuita]